jgi:hypothetical protein
MSNSTSGVRRYVKQALTDHPDAGPQEIATYAAAQVPQKELRDCLAEALVDLSRILIGTGRRDALDGAVGNNSPKMQDRALWWTQMLTERVNIGGEWKALGDCTLDDLAACIAEREKLIGRISDQIDNYRRLQKLMIENKAQRVSDIPAQTERKA